MTEHEEKNGANSLPEGEEGEENLDDALEALDLDTNLLAESYDEEDKKVDEASAELAPPESSAPSLIDTSQHSEGALENVVAAPVMEDDGEKDSWKDRLEIYSRHFKPSHKEREELESIAKRLEVKSMLKGSPGLMDNLMGKTDDETDPYDPQSQWNRLVSGKATERTEKLPISIVLKRGQVLYKDVDDHGNPTTHHGVEMILFTRGFLLAKREIKSSFGIFGKREEYLVPLGSALWIDVHQIQTTDDHTILLRCGSKTPKDEIRFEVLPAQNSAQWRIDLQTAAIRAHQNFLTEPHDELGWQYRLCHTPWFTEAVTGRLANESEEGHEISTSDSAAKSLDVLDEYNSLAPLHYATRANHTEIMQLLLQAGADPDVEDGEGKTPMYYTDYYELPAATVQLLEEFGATKSAKAEEEKKGELFGKVAETEIYREQKRASEAAAKKAQEEAEAAQNQMANNINAMQKRGEMIEELGDKANDLEAGAQDYADMATQLKEKLKKKSKWGF